jgi:serine/threonine-protein kinase HipA
MENLIVDVRIWGQYVGSLVWDDARAMAIFEYDSRFRRNGLELAPLTMPLSQGSRPFSFPSNRTECFKGLPGLIADALPDKFGNQIITEWFTRQGLPVGEITPLERLCYVGQRAMGALEFEPNKASELLNESTEVYIDELTRLAEEIFTKREAFQERMFQEDKTILDILRVGTSAGGAKPKAIIAYNEQTNEVRSGQVKAPEGYGYWLLKFDGVTYSEHGSVMENPKGIGNVEYAYYKMAQACGIDMMECRLLSEGDNCHFMTRRFDRTADGEKIHIQTVAGLAHLDRDQRHSYEEIFGIMRKMNLPMEASQQLYRRMVFNVMARNNDDHTKNFSFLMDRQGHWRLAPAYDLCYSYKPGGRWVGKHQLSLNGKQDDFSRQDLLTVGTKMGIRRCNEIIEEVANAVSLWHSIAKDCGVRESHVAEVEKNLLTLNDKGNE